MYNRGVDMEIRSRPHLGSTAPTTASRTAQKLAGFAIQYVDQAPAHRNYLDIGCGNGFITRHVDNHFDQVVGIDVEQDRLAEFRREVAEDSRYQVLEMPSEALAFADNAFHFATSFEVLEHVANVAATADEIVRVLAPGGILVVSVPQALFPIENHGIRIGEHVLERKVPLLPYIPPLHRRFSLARVFLSRELDALFEDRGLTLLETGYVAPQFERAATRSGSWEGRLTFLRAILERFETVPGIRRLVGVSMLKAFKKPR